jgi:hypothetical protein
VLNKALQFRETSDTRTLSFEKSHEHDTKHSLRDIQNGTGDNDTPINGSVRAPPTPEPRGTIGHQDSATSPNNTR